MLLGLLINRPLSIMENILVFLEISWINTNYAPLVTFNRKTTRFLNECYDTFTVER